MSIDSLRIIGSSVKENGVTYDPYLDKLGNYFVYQKLHERYGWTFEYFVGLVTRGAYTKENGYGY